MKNKITALVLVLTLLMGISAYAVPVNLWEYNSRFENLFTVDRTVSEYDMLQRLLDYLKIADKEAINGEDTVKSGDLLRALAEIVGLPYGEDAETSQILSDLKTAKVLRNTAKSSMLSLQEVLYAGARITGLVIENESDANVYAEAKKAGLLRNISYSAGRNLTKSEAAQLLYNIISVNVKYSDTYTDGGFVFNDKIGAPILESKYGIVLREGVVTSVFGETIFNDNKLNEDEIEIDGKKYDFNPDESKEGLLGRHTAYFVDTEENLVVFIEPTTENTVYTVNGSSIADFKSDIVEYDLDTDEKEFNVDNDTIVVLNGMAIGSYSIDLLNLHFTPGTSMVAVDNDRDDVCDVIMLRKWESFVAAFEAGDEGTIVFDYDMLFNGQNYVDVTPDNRNVHVTVLRDGVPANYSEIKAGDIISISASANASKNQYIVIELGYKTVTGVLGMVSAGKYYIEDKEYNISTNLIDAQNNNPNVKSPELGKSYAFYIDIAGNVANVIVPKGYEFGYLAKLSVGRGMEPDCKIKIFAASGKMIEMDPAKKVTLHTYGNDYSYDNDVIGFTNKIIEEAKSRAGGESLYNGDYRSIVQYKLNGKNQLEELWLPYDNTTATSYGKSGYQLTYDVAKSGNRTYYGVLWGNGMFRLPATSPIFNIPGDINAKDAMYSMGSINQTQYNDTLQNTMELYSVDEYRIVSAAVIKGEAKGEGDIGSYSQLFVVDRIARATNSEKEPVYKLYAHNGAKESNNYFTTEEDLVSDADSGWEVVEFKNLKFGDIIQFYESNGDIRRFRVVYRASNPGNDRNQVTVAGSTNEGLSDGQKVEYGEIQQMVVSTGSYVGKKLNVLKIMQNGEEYEYFMKSNQNATVCIIDTASKKVKPSTFAELRKGDKVMLRSTWAAVDTIYVIR